MKFNIKKVMTPKDDNLEQLIGWKGYFADTFGEIAAAVKQAEKSQKSWGELRKIYMLESLSGFENQNFYISWLFYPVEPPERKQKPKYRPCKNLEELARCANKGFFEYSGNDDKVMQYNLFNSLRGKTVYDASLNTIQYIDGIDFNSKSGLIIHLSIRTWVSFQNLFDEYEWADKKGEFRIIGVKE